MKVMPASPPAGIFLAFTLTLPGCAQIPASTSQAKPMDVPAIGQTLQASAAAVGAEWPKLDWWADFHNPGLEKLIAAALRDNPNLKLTATRVREAQALADFRRGSLFPSVDLQMSLAGRRFSANSIQNKLSGEEFVHAIVNPLSLNYHLDFWGRDRASLEAALGITRAREAELAQARVLLSTAVARTYFRLAAATERLALAQTMAATLRENLRVTEVRLRTGLDSRIPVTQAKVKLETALQREAVTRAEAELLRDQLATLAGQGPDWVRHIDVTASDLSATVHLPENLPLRLIAHRPDLVAAREGAEAVAHEVKVAKTAFYPDVNLVGFAGLDSVALPELFFNATSAAFAFGPVLQLPIFQGGRLEANLKAAVAVYDAAVESYNGTLLRAVQEVADALARWREADARLGSQRQATASAQENQRLIKSNHALGLNPRGPVLEADLAVDEQRFLQKALEAERTQAAIQLIEALGGGYVNPNEEKHGTTHSSQKD
jgi:NodT family efflux transporter outer membrane factor (OMF) lipoprotein